MKRLQDKVAIVTGAGTRSDGGVGTGQATAMLFAREGAKVVVADLDARNAEKTCAAIQAEGGTASMFEADVSKESGCKALVEDTLSRYGSLHILMNNVGISGSGDVTEITEELWDRVLAVDLKSMAFMSKYAVPAMDKAGGGSIINISSVDGMRAGMWRNVPYAAAKGGVISLTRAMAAHHGRQNIRVNCIAPGLIYTNMVSGMADDARNIRRKIAPLGTEGNAWDIAMAAVFLASDESRWITGVLLPVDAGLMASAPTAVLGNLSESESTGDGAMPE